RQAPRRHGPVPPRLDRHRAALPGRAAARRRHHDRGPQGAWLHGHAHGRPQGARSLRRPGGAGPRVPRLRHGGGRGPAQGGTDQGAAGLGPDAPPRPVRPGNAGMSPSAATRLRVAGELILPFAVVAVAWELFAAFGPLSPKLFPSLATVARTFWRLATSGVLLTHAQGTLVRLVIGFALAAVLGVAVGLA